MEEEKYIQLEKNKILKIGIKDEKGNPTGEHLEFDLEDIDSRLKFQNMIKKVDFIKKNFERKNLMIQQKKNRNGQVNDDEEYRLVRDTFYELEKVYNTFLGKNGVRKILGTKNLQWTSIAKINKIIDKDIKPLLQENAVDVAERIRTMFGDMQSEKEDTLE